MTVSVRSQARPRRHRRPGRITARWSLVLAAGTMISALAAPAAQAGTAYNPAYTGMEVAYVGATGDLMLADIGPNRVTPTAVHDTFLTVSPGTHPAITGQYTASGTDYIAAFREASTGHLWVVSHNLAPSDTGQPVAAGTSPAATTVASPNLAANSVIFWVKPDGHLWRWDSTMPSDPSDTGSTVLSGSSPAAATDVLHPTVAFARPDSNLGFINQWGTDAVGLGVAAGTSPAMSTDINNIVFNANQQHDIWRMWDRRGYDMRLGMDPASSPATVDDSLAYTGHCCAGNGYEAFQSNVHTLYWVNGDIGTFAGHNTGLPMDNGASPAMTLSWGYPIIAFAEESTHRLFFFQPRNDPGFQVTNTGLAAMPGSTPAITDLVRTTVTQTP